jgi:hypothetical protein
MSHIIAVMELTDEDVQEFIEAWREDGGEPLDLETGRAEMRRLLDFFVTMEELLLNESDPDERPNNVNDNP